MNKETKNKRKYKFIKWFFRNSFYQMISIMIIGTILTLIFVLTHLILTNYYCYNFENNMISTAHGLIDYNNKNDYLKTYSNDRIIADSLFYIKKDYSNNGYIYIGEKEPIFIIEYEDNSPLVKVFSFSELFNGNFYFWVHEELLQEEYIDENIWYFYKPNQGYVKVVK